MKITTLLLTPFVLLFSSLAFATPPPVLPDLSGLMMVAFDRTPAFTFVGGTYSNCGPRRLDRKKSETASEVCDVDAGSFTMARAGGAPLSVRLEKIIYNEYDDATKPSDIKRIYSFRGTWTDLISGHPVNSRVAVSILEAVDGTLSGYVKNMEFELSARLLIKI